MTSELEESLMQEGWSVLDRWVGRLNAWDRSRAAVRLNEEGTEESTVLAILAKRKFGEVPVGKRAVWGDKNAGNETEENVQLVGLPGATTASPSRAVRSALGVPSNSPEYVRLYREKNREKFREACKRYQKKVREQAREYRREHETTRDTNTSTFFSVDTSYTEDMQEKLLAIPGIRELMEEEEKKKERT